MNQEKQSLWEQRIKEQKTSGLTVPVWCEQNQLTKHAYYYGHKRIGDAANPLDIIAAYFFYSRTRSGDVAKKLLEGYHNYLTTAAYAGYEKADGIKRNLCWAHVRRYMIESIPLDNNGKEIHGSKGAKGREFINLLFKLEDEMNDLTYEEKKEKRQVASRAVLDAFWSWVLETSMLSTTNEKLITALKCHKPEEIS